MLVGSLRGELLDHAIVLSASAPILVREFPGTMTGVEPRTGWEKAHPKTLITFGMKPTRPAAGFEYLELRERFQGASLVGTRFKEKPDPATADHYLHEGPERYLWTRIFDLKLGDKGVEDMRCLCSCVNRAQGSLPEADG